MILTLIEHDRGVINPYSLQLLTFTRILAAKDNIPHKTILIGHNVQQLALELNTYDLDGIFLIQDERMANYNAEILAEGVIQLVEATKPIIIMTAATDKGNEVLSHIGARLDIPMSTNTSNIQLGDNNKLIRYRWGSSLLEETIINSNPLLISLALNIIKAEKVSANKPEIENFQAEFSDTSFRVQLIGRDEDTEEGTSLASAPIVIGGGRGVGSAEGFSVLEELSACINGAVGGSRVATNNGWISHARQVGLTGNRIAPKLYIACGISGAVQHLVGCKGAKNIMVINNDPQAPFFAKADYGIVGDLHEVLPAITRKLKKETL